MKKTIADKRFEAAAIAQKRVAIDDRDEDRAHLKRITERNRRAFKKAMRARGLNTRKVQL